MFIILLLLTIRNIPAQDDCVREVFFKKNKKKFIVSFTFPKIQQSEENKKILIACEMYTKISIGDRLESEQIKQFNLNIDEGIPHGAMLKYEFIVLKK
jgi:hypothetical protein